MKSERIYNADVTEQWQTNAVVFGEKVKVKI
jgi:hypothetical protein